MVPLAEEVVHEFFALHPQHTNILRTPKNPRRVSSTVGAAGETRSVTASGELVPLSPEARGKRRCAGAGGWAPLGDVARRLKVNAVVVMSG